MKDIVSIIAVMLVRDVIVIVIIELDCCFFEFIFIRFIMFEIDGSVSSIILDSCNDFLVSTRIISNNNNDDNNKNT